MGFKLDRNRRQERREFEQAVRRDAAINITARVCWLMVALSHRNGYCSKSINNMALELTAKPDQVRQARRKLVQLGLFERSGPWRYKRVTLSDDETRTEFWRRARADHHLDLKGRLAWFLADETREDGTANLSRGDVAKALGVRQDTAVGALRDMREVLQAHFTIEPGGGRSLKTRYTRRIIEIVEPFAHESGDKYEDEGEHEGDGYADIAERVVAARAAGRTRTRATAK